MPVNDYVAARSGKHVKYQVYCQGGNTCPKPAALSPICGLAGFMGTTCGVQTRNSGDWAHQLGQRTLNTGCDNLGCRGFRFRQLRVSEVRSWTKLLCTSL